MKKHCITSLVVATILALTLVAFAQPGGGAGGMRGGRGNFQARREAQTKAIEALEQAVAKLKGGMTPMGRRSGQRGNFQEMSQEERASFREQMMQRRQERQDAVATIESQVVMLKGRRQLQTEHEEALAHLQAAEAQARSENAPKTAALIAEMIQDKQTKYDELTAKLGYVQN